MVEASSSQYRGRIVLDLLALVVSLNAAWIWHSDHGEELFAQTIWPKSGNGTKFYKGDVVLKTNHGNGMQVWLQDTVNQVIRDS